jgi:8-oxo-dGTP diphosphatase
MSSDIPNCFYRVSAKALILDETGKKFLVVREDSGIWDLPGGGVDWGETAEQCLRRELKEEMGFTITDIDSHSPRTLTVPHPNGTWLMWLIFTVKVKDLDFTPSPECREIKFISQEEIDSINTLNIIKDLAKTLNKV